MRRLCMCIKPISLCLSLPLSLSLPSKYAYTYSPIVSPFVAKDLPSYSTKTQ